MSEALRFRTSILYESGDAIPVGGEPGIYDFGKDLFKSESIVDAAYNIYIKMMVRQFEGTSDTAIEDFGPAFLGLYLCGVRRTVLTHQYDSVNDQVPSEFSTWLGDDTVEVFREVPKVPRGWKTAAVGRHFRNTLLHLTGDKASATSGMITLMPDGRILPLVRAEWGQSPIDPGLPLTTMLASVGINIFCDRKHLWQVRTQEPTVFANYATALTVGVSPEHIKSLFYARSLPLTESGRKRPILHWVRAHQRRLADGIDIDVSQHLRGITGFEMGGFEWSITNPIKEAP